VLETSIIRSKVEIQGTISDKCNYGICWWCGFYGKKITKCWI